MIGSDEFNYRSSRTPNHPTGDISDMEYIETFLASSSRVKSERQLLIDIVCPQPQSRRRGTMASAGNQTSLRAARTNSTSGWQK